MVEKRTCNCVVFLNFIYHLEMPDIIHTPDKVVKYVGMWDLSGELKGVNNEILRKTELLGKNENLIIEKK